MRRMTYFVMALALVLGFTQCKKEQMPANNQTEGIRITLDVNGGNSNSRVIVDPTGNNGQYNYATVNFESGDMIYVGYNNAYVGSLTYSDGNFSGSVSISETVEGEHLHFYFLGGVGFEPTVEDNTATVVISDQTQKLPVISYSPSKEVFTTTNTSYSAKLQNKISIMKFNVTTASTSAICITGMNNKVTVDFTAPSGTDNGFAYDKDGEGVIKMHGVTTDNTETWAIVLPQAALEEGEEGSAYTADLRYLGTRPAMEEIEMNTFLNVGLDLSVGTANPHFHDLSNLTADYEAQDGDILSGTINPSYKISVAHGATITLSDAHLDYADNANWSGIQCVGDANIFLTGTNTVNSGYSANRVDHAGIYIPKDRTLIIDGTGSLTVHCGATVEGAPSNWSSLGAAAIGGGRSEHCGNIIINGGVVNATGDYAGIGGGMSANCGNITINGGEVTAIGRNYSAGIGTSAHSTNNDFQCGIITITGGFVTATGGSGAAGIGAGRKSGAYNSANICSGIVISGGEVTATGGPNAAGIGSGYATSSSRAAKSTCGDINITGGIVVATGGDKGAGIGSGNTGFQSNQSNCGAITITNSVTRVTAAKAEGNNAPNSIGKGSGSGTCGTVIIGGTVYYENNAYVGTGSTYLTQDQIVYP